MPPATGAARAVSVAVALSGRADAPGGDAAPDDAAGDPGAEEPPRGASGPARWLPDERFVEAWARRAVEAVLAGAPPLPDPRLAGEGALELELSVHLADVGLSRALNREHRGRDRPTNVLSFPSGLPALEGEGASLVALGDLVPCPELIRREALEQGKALGAHWAHLVVHGTLHLLGLDHGDEASASAMEALETGLLSAGGLPDPYRTVPDEAEA